MAAFRPLTIQSGKNTQLATTDSTEVGTGISSSGSGDLNVTPGGTNMTLAAGKALTAASGAGAFDFSAASGTFKTSTGAVTVGGATTFTAAGTALTVDNNAKVTGTADLATIDRAGTISIGATNGTSITIGRTGQLTTVAGNLSVSGTETIVGTTTFQNSATFEGDVDIGNAATDTLTITSRIDGDVHMIKEVARTLDIDASTTAGAAGASLTVKSGAGAAGTAAVSPTASGAGGALAWTAATGGAGVGTSTTGQLAADAGAGAAATITGGTGGAGTTTGSIDNAVAGAGGSVTLSGGAAGTAGGAPGGAGASGGSVILDGGAATGAGTAGSVNLGANAPTSSVTIGRSGITITANGNVDATAGLDVSGAALTVANQAITQTTGGQVTFAGNVDANAGLDITGGALTIANQAITQTTGGQVTFAGNVDATSGLDVTGAALTAAAGLTLTTTGITMTGLDIGGTAAEIGDVYSDGFARFAESAGDPASVANKGFVYAKDVSALTELFFRSDAGVVQITSNGQLASSTQATQVAVTGLTTTGLADGDFGYASAADTMTKTNATAEASSLVIGANEGTAGSMTVAGVVESAKFTTDGGSPGNGARVYLALGTADTNTGAGKLTATAPTAAGQFVAEVGICLNNANYAASKTAEVLMQPKAVLAL